MIDHKDDLLSIKTVPDLVSAIGEAVRSFQDATDAFDDAACRRLGISRTDLQCLGIVAQQGLVPVGAIGLALHLTRGATSTAVDRVERQGYVRRLPDPADRRGVLIELTPHGEEAVMAIWHPMVVEGERQLARYSEHELQTILHFLTEAAEMQYRHAK